LGNPGMNKVSLYRYEDSYVDMAVIAYFRKETLIIVGYNVGKKMEDEWSDPDFQLIKVTVDQEEVMKLYPLLNVSVGDKAGLLNSLAEKFNTISCYGEFLDFLDSNGIKDEALII
jgi:hypothetical protein